MFLRIKNVLNAAEVARLEQLSRELRFVDGRISPVWWSRTKTPEPSFDR